MPKTALQDPRFKAFNYSRDGGAYLEGCFGFSFKDGDLRAELQPINEKNRTHVWGATIMRGSEAIEFIGADDPWTLAEAVLVAAEEIR